MSKKSRHNDDGRTDVVLVLSVRNKHLDDALRVLRVARNGMYSPHLTEEPDIIDGWYGPLVLTDSRDSELLDALGAHLEGHWDDATGGDLAWKYRTTAIVEGARHAVERVLGQPAEAKS